MPLPTGEYNVRSFNATGNGTLQTTELQNAMNATRDFGGTLYVPAGDYLVDNTVFDTVNTSGQFKNSNVIIRGDGPATRIILDSGGASNPIFSIHGASAATRATWFTLKDMTLDGDGQSATWLNFVEASLVRMERVQIVNTLGTGIYARDWWDSVLHDVTFDDVGNNTTFSSSIALNATGSNVDAASNNIKFEAVRFLNNRYYSVRMNALTREIYFLGCTFQGRTDMASGAPVYSYENIRMDDAYAVSFTGCHFRNAGTYHIKATDSEGLVVANSSLEKAWFYGIQLNNTDNCCITNNNFATSTGGAANGDPSLSPTLRGNIDLSASSTGCKILRNLGGQGA